MSTRVTSVLAGALIAAAMLTAPSSVHAATNYPWCVQYGGGLEGIGATSCGFVTWEQCMATARGMGAMCVENPAYVEPNARPAKPRNRKRS